MKTKYSWLNPRTKPVPWISGTLVLLGFLLANGTRSETWWWAILLTGLGAFGPGLLRELGWLRDKDEFQIQASRRAGYHAFLAAGLVSFLWIAFIRSGPRHLKAAEELATFFAALLWFTWLFSSLVNYWGARKTSFRLLLIYGGAWLLFCIASEWMHPLGMLMQSLITVPFFACAWLSRKWPRMTGALLLAASIFFFVLLSRLHQQRGLGLVTSATTMILFIGPLFASGIALMAERVSEERPLAV
ncbi:MAG: hypothetical protein ACHQPI_07315 [Thermoanaerobaculia bacterium]